MTDENGQLRLRAVEDLPPAELSIQSPYDVEARYSQKRQTEWTGYKVHLTETCEAEAPHLITNVETTPATTSDKSVTATIHQHLAQKQLSPETHLVDAGYIDIDLIVSSQREQLELLGPVQAYSCWQAQVPEAYSLTDFEIDWQQQQVTCPEGKLSRAWRPREDSFGNSIIEIWFSRSDCTPCPARARCTRAKKNPRTLKIKPQAQYLALQAARQYQTTPDFKHRYNQRAGIESTISQGTRAFNLRRCRYIGLAKTHLQHLLTAAAINLTRAVFWLQHGLRPSRPFSRFAALALS
jgi:transposase